MNPNQSSRRAPFTALTAIVAGALLAACGSGSGSSGSAERRTFVGTVEGMSAFVAVVTDGSRALAYACDGMPAVPTGSTPTLQVWFNAPSDGETVDARQSGSHLMVRLTGSAMSGTVALPDGRTLAVRGSAVRGDPGLYRAEASGGAGTAVGGWIVAADGQQRGGVGGSGVAGQLSGARLLDLSQPTFTVAGLASARIAKVGITPIPIP